MRWIENLYGWLKKNGAVSSRPAPATLIFRDSVRKGENFQKWISSRSSPVIIFFERHRGGYRELVAGVQHDPASQQSQRKATGTGGYFALRLPTVLGDQQQLRTGFNFESDPLFYRDLGIRFVRHRREGLTV
jgi:hypothetical protein